ncbi:MAG: zinc ribbon domain-containing protein [Bacteroidales bacterium]
MKKFNSLLDAARFAATISENWHFANSDETYIKDTLLTIAKTSDAEDPIDEDGFYLVSPSGAIGLCPEGEDIDWLFLVGIDDEDLPSTYTESPELNFCPKCGNPIVSGANFCDECGEHLF